MFLLKCFLFTSVLLGQLLAQDVDSPADGETLPTTVDLLSETATSESITTPEITTEAGTEQTTETELPVFGEGSSSPAPTTSSDVSTSPSTTTTTEASTTTNATQFSSSPGSFGYRGVVGTQLYMIVTSSSTFNPLLRNEQNMTFAQPPASRVIYEDQRNTPWTPLLTVLGVLIFLVVLIGVLRLFNKRENRYERSSNAV